jgi:hypothetical protein
VSIVYDTTALKFWVAYADGPSDPATNQNYVEFDLNVAPPQVPVKSWIPAICVLASGLLLLRRRNAMH